MSDTTITELPSTDFIGAEDYIVLDRGDKTYKINLNLVGAPNTQDIIYISPTGDDFLNEGTDLNVPFKTIKKACSYFAQSTSTKTTIYLNPGVYEEVNPLVIPKNVSLIGHDQDSVVVKPLNPNYDVFWLSDNTSVKNLTITDHLSPSVAISFPTVYVSGGVIDDPEYNAAYNTTLYEISEPREYSFISSMPVIENVFVKSQNIVFPLFGSNSFSSLTNPYLTAFEFAQNLLDSSKNILIDSVSASPILVPKYPSPVPAYDQVINYILNKKSYYEDNDDYYELRNLLISSYQIDPYVYYSRMGQSINWNTTDTNNELGYSVAFNSDGSRIAIGARKANGGTTDSGEVRVYEYNGTGWTQLGNTVTTNTANTNFGHAVALNGVGDSLVVGIPNSTNGSVFRYVLQNNQWITTNTISGPMANARAGSSVAISKTGEIVIYGTPAASGGNTYITIRSFNNNWIVDRSFPLADKAGERNCVAISDNGQVIAYARPGYNLNYGIVNVEKASTVGSNQYSPYGQDITNPTASSTAGMSVSLNGDGTRLAVGFPFYFNNKGVVRVYQYDSISGLWVQLGIDLIGDVNDDNFGTSVKLNTLGNRLVVGSPKGADSGFTTNRGSVKIYELIGSQWVRLGTTINGSLIGEYLGWDVAINSSGDKIAVGAPNSSIRSGFANVYSSQNSETPFFRDVKILFDSLVYDLSANTNRLAIETGKTFTTNISSLILQNDNLTHTRNAILSCLNYIFKDFEVNIFDDTPLAPGNVYYSVSSEFTIIKNYVNGITAAYDPINPVIDVGYIDTANWLIANKDSFKNEIKHFLNIKYYGLLTVSEIDWYADNSMLILEAISDDVKNVANSETIHYSNIYYYNIEDYDFSNEIASDALLYLKRIISPFTQNNNDYSGFGVLVDGDEILGDFRGVEVKNSNFELLGGIGLISKNNGYLKATDVKTEFCDNSILSENGGLAYLNGCTSSFGLSGLVARETNTTKLPILSGSTGAASNINSTQIRVTNLIPSKIYDTFSYDGLIAKTPYSNLYFDIQHTIGGPYFRYAIEKPITPISTTVYDINLTFPLTANIQSGTNIIFYQRAVIVANAHTFEYVGCGNNYTKLPQYGGIPNPQNEICFDTTEGNPEGIVYYTSTNQDGRYNMGKQFTVFEADRVVSVKDDLVGTPDKSKLHSFVIDCGEV